MTTRESGRSLRIADFLRDEIAQIAQRHMRDPRVGMVSVNEVKVSRDLSYADIYVSSLAAQTETARQELIAVLNGAAGFFRSELAKRHTMRTTPRLRFHYDDVPERGQRLDALIDRALRDDQGRASLESASNEARSVDGQA